MNAPYALHDLSANGRSIGGILIDIGRLTAADAERVLRHQKDNGMRFGEAACALKLISEKDIQDALAQQFDYPSLVPGKSALSKEVVAAYHPQRAAIEGLRALRSQLMARWFGVQPTQCSMAILSAEPRSGRSWLAANLAVVFSQLGERTLLIDGDMRNPRQHKLFGLDNSSGLSAILSGRESLKAIRPIPGLRALSVLPAGVLPPNPLELLARPAFSQLLEAAAGAYDVILIDTPSASKFADAQTIATRTRGAMLLCRRHVAAVKPLQRLTRDLQECGVQLVGSVFNDR